MTEINTIEELKKSLEPKDTYGVLTRTLQYSTIEVAASIDADYPILFQRCTFNKTFTMKDVYSYPVTFEDCTFTHGLILRDVSFLNRVDFDKVTFITEVDFINTKFHEACNFFNCVFSTKTNFFRSQFLGNVFFSYILFYDDVLFTHTLFNKSIAFRNIAFHQGLDLSRAIITGTLKLFHFHLLDFKISNNFSKDVMALMEEYPIGKERFITEKHKIETFRIIKKQFESQKDFSLALQFSALEMQSQAKYFRTNMFTKHRANQDLIILWLNWLSNNYGRYWTRGVFFTFFVGWICFYLTLGATNHYTFGLNFSYQNITNTGRYFFEFLTPTHKVDFLDAEGASIWTYLWDFTGRVFIAYGIYQTIQAFRKYRNS